MKKAVMLKQLELEKTEQDFFNTLLELNYANERQRQTLVQKAQSIAQTIPHYSNWPHDPQQFWNAEALSWKQRISPDVRAALREELSFLQGKNLDLGSGSFSYVSNSVAVDFSEEMLRLNDVKEKIVADLEGELPVEDESFDSVTMNFLANYIKNVPGLLSEAKRALKVGGTLAIVQSAHPVMDVHRMHYKNSYGEAELKILLRKDWYHVRSYTKNVGGRELVFLVGEKSVDLLK
jgi:SAM-dependent methyltransferase